MLLNGKCTRGWKQTYRLKNGRQITLIDKLANGLRVRAFVWVDGAIQLVDGIQLSDGRIWVRGRVFDRADSLIQSKFAPVPPSNPNPPGE